MITQLRTYGPLRLALVAIVFVLLTAWAGISLLPHDGFSDGLVSAGTPQQVAAAQQMLQTLPSVTGAVVDPYDTACRQPQTWCLSTSSLTATQLMPEALALLKSRGATVDRQACDAAAEEPQCTATLHWHGARLTLASNAFMTPPIWVGTGTSLAVAVDQPRGAGRPGTGLPAWSALNPLPAAWAVDAPCISNSAQGCVRYYSDAESAPPVLGSSAAIITAAIAALQAHGYSTGRYCRAAHDKIPQRCFVSLWKYRTLGGKDGIDGSVVVSRLSTTTVGVSVTFESTV